LAVIYEKLRTQAHIQANEFYRTLAVQRCAEVQKLLSSMPQRLAEISEKKGGQPITSLCNDISKMQLFFPFNGFFIEHFVSEGSRFLSPGVDNWV
jgi:hypothetical protein